MRRLLGALLLIGASAAAIAQADASRDPLVDAREMRAWLAKMHEAAKTRSYTGSLVVMNRQGMASSKVARFCVGPDTYEQVDLLDGIKRSQLRHNTTVHTIYPDQRVASVETRDAFDSFPQLVRADSWRMADYYELRLQGEERVAGHLSRVLLLQPRDSYRLPQRLWAEEKSGLLLKTQILAANGEVLEQSAFSEVSLNPPSQAERIKGAIKRLEKFNIEKVPQKRVSLKQAGWQFAQVKLPGYKEVDCNLRMMHSAPIFVEIKPVSDAREVLHCAFSDGLASFSMFIEPATRDQPSSEQFRLIGATHSITLVKQDSLVTLVGEVPRATLAAFAQALEKRK
jgi:sigma-E factor negative regulatory protein RseB